MGFVFVAEYSLSYFFFIVVGTAPILYSLETMTN